MSKKLIYIAIISTASLLLILLFVLLPGKQKATNLTIGVAPKDSKIILDSSSYIKVGDNQLSSGEHILKFLHPGFKSIEKKIFIDPSKLKKIYVTLSPNSKEGQNYFDNNQEEFMEIEALGGQYFTENNRIVNEKYPIIKQLPIDSSPLFRIDYGVSKKYPNDSQKIAIYISSPNASGRQLALQTISDSGYDLSDYEIIFQGLE
jgi:hypothetical protein